MTMVIEIKGETIVGCIAFEDEKTITVDVDYGGHSEYRKINRADILEMYED